LRRVHKELLARDWTGAAQKTASKCGEEERKNKRGRGRREGIL
jgi:hypothetical protein